MPQIKPAPAKYWRRSRYSELSRMKVHTLAINMYVSLKASNRHMDRMNRDRSA